MRLIRLVIPVLLVLLSGVAVAAAQDTDDIDLTLLENGQTFEGTLTTEQDTQLFAFFGSEDDSVTVHMRQVPDNSPLNPLLVLFSADGEVLAADDDGATSPYYSAIVENFILPEDGLYFLIATHNDALIHPLADTVDESDADNGLDFELEIRGITPPDDDDFPALGVLNSGSQAIAIDTITPISLLLLEGEDGQTITVGTEASGDSEVDTMLWVFNPSGLRIALNDDANNAPYSQINDLDLEDDGIYFILVTGYQFEQTNESGFSWEQEGTVRVTVQ